MEKQKYAVYYCNILDSVIEETFDSLDDAKKYVSEQTKGKVVVYKEDNTYHNNHFWYEVYDGEMFDSDKNLKDPVYESEYYYYK